MRVTLERETQEVGVFRKKPVYYLFAKVDLSEEEKHLLGKNTGEVIYKFFDHYHNQETQVYLGWLLSGSRFPVACVYDENLLNVEEDNVREMLQNLKNRIDYRAEPRKEKDTFEL